MSSKSEEERLAELLDVTNPTQTYTRIEDVVTFRKAAGVDPASSKPEGHVRIVCISGLSYTVKL